MKIIILGGGQVGTSVAENLVTENNDITVVDTDANRLQELQDRLDLRTVVGNGAHPEILRQAGGEDADMILSVTNSD
jgi:trk system potassium uptake protein TrkA